MYRYLLVLWTCCLHAAPDYYTVGTNSEFPPYSYLENGELTGFDIDVAKEAARRLGKEVKFKDLPFDALIPELVLGHVDFVAAGMTATEERAKRVLFTESYLNDDPFVFFTPKDSDISVDNLKGKTIVVVEGFTADIYMSDKSGFELIRLPTQADAFMAVKYGRADAFVTASTTVEQFVKSQNSDQYKAVIIPGTSETCVLALPKSKAQLRDDLQTVLNEMIKDGTLEQFKKKWNVK